MNRTKGVTLALCALVSAGAMDASAQAGVDGRPGIRRGPGVEAVMRLREELELTEAQIGELDAIRAEGVAFRGERAQEVAEMRSRLAAGQIQRSELMAFMEDRAEGDRAELEQLRERVDAVLTEDQLSTLGELRARGRAFAGGRMSARRGGRPGPGLRRGGIRERPGMDGRRGFRRGPGAFGPDGGERPMGPGARWRGDGGDPDSSTPPRSGSETSPAG